MACKGRYCLNCKKCCDLNHFIPIYGKSGKILYRCNIVDGRIKTRPKKKKCRLCGGKMFPLEHFIEVSRGKKIVFACKEKFQKRGNKLTDNTKSIQTLRKKFEGYLDKFGYKPNSKESVRNKQLIKNYNIDLKYYNKLLEEQNYCCAICKLPQNPNKKSFHVDHCHNSFVVRGLLCSNCNLALGLFKENDEFLKMAFLYLYENKKETVLSLS